MESSSAACHARCTRGATAPQWDDLVRFRPPFTHPLQWTISAHRPGSQTQTAVVKQRHVAISRVLLQGAPERRSRDEALSPRMARLLQTQS